MSTLLENGLFLLDEPTASLPPEEKSRVYGFIAKQQATKNKIKEGVYFAVTGPSYETSAEIKAFRKLGGDVVGMSLVTESITAAQMGIKVLALTYVSNKAAGITTQKLSHKEVLALGKKAATSLEKIITEVTGKI